MNKNSNYNIEIQADLLDEINKFINVWSFKDKKEVKVIITDTKMKDFCIKYDYKIFNISITSDYHIRISINNLILIDKYLPSLRINAVSSLTGQDIESILMSNCKFSDLFK